MAVPFEDPRKAEMRARCRDAIDAAGHDLIEPPVPIALPAQLGLRGKILPDVQSVDAAATTYIYFLRPAFDRPIPQWLANFARGAQLIPDLRLYVVVEEVSVLIERSCRAVEAGLLRLRDDIGFDQIVDPTEIEANLLASRFQEEIRRLRREMENKLQLNLDEVQRNYGTARALTANMASEKRDEYIAEVEEVGVRWREWAGRVSVRLDEVAATGDSAQLVAIERMIADGIGVESRLNT